MPGVDHGVATAAVGQAAVGFRQAQWLATALEDPDVFAGSPDAPKVVDRLVAALTAAGVDGLKAPCCSMCGRTSWVTQRVNGRRTCSMCASRARAEPCSRCQRVRPVSLRLDNGDAVCDLCRSGDRTRWELCNRCGTVAAVARRLPDGAGLCRRCIRPYRHCTSCGHERPCIGVRDGNPICESCRRRRADCSRCGKPATVSAVWATGPVCTNCRYVGLEARTTCTGCGASRRPDPRHPSGQCSDCLDLPPLNVCAACGREDRIYRAGNCYRCVLVDEVDTLLNGDPRLEPLRNVIVNTDRPRSVFRWLHADTAQSALARIVAGDLELSHEAIDVNSAVRRLRGILVESGLLEERNEAIASLERWVQSLLHTVADPTNRRAVEAFATWWVIRRLRRRDGFRTTRDTSRPRAQIRRAVEFCAFLADRQTALADCDQETVEHFLADGPARHAVGAFLKWAHQHQLCRKFDVPVRHQPWPTRTLDPQRHQAIIDHLLDDDSLRASDRVAGLFVACYGQLGARIVRLTTDDIDIGDDRVLVRFGRDWIPLPEPIGGLARVLVAERRGRASTEQPGQSRWLFPGGMPGQPLGSDQMCRRLQAVGVDSLMVRTAAMLDFGAEVPPSIIADVIGVHENVAARWVRAAGGDWAAYVANRSRRTGSATG